MGLHFVGAFKVPRRTSCIFTLNVSATAGCVDSNIITVNMNNASRKVKNPLLSAAGPGFPFDSYTENTLLVPVNPTSAVLRDGESIQRETLGEVQHILYIIMT